MWTFYYYVALAHLEPSALAAEVAGGRNVLLGQVERTEDPASGFRIFIFTKNSSVTLR